jgi:hypothetical protein
MILIATPTRCASMAATLRIEAERLRIVQEKRDAESRKARSEMLGAGTLNNMPGMPLRVDPLAVLARALEEAAQTYDVLGELAAEVAEGR